MRELIATQRNPRFGVLIIHIRVIGKNVFLKVKESAQKNQMIASLRSKGAIIQEASGWIKADIFANHDLVKLNGKEFNPKELHEEDLELLLYEFFKEKYIAAKFVITEK